MENRINPWLWQGGICIPPWLLRREEVSPGAKLCYSLLSAIFGEEENDEPSVAEMATDLGVSERQVQRYLAELSNFNLIAIIPQTGNKPNKVEFYDHGWMYEGFYLEEQREEVAS
jgi:hypothetical protein